MNNHRETLERPVTVTLSRSAWLGFLRGQPRPLTGEIALAVQRALHEDWLAEGDYGAARRSESRGG